MSESESLRLANSEAGEKGCMHSWTEEHLSATLRVTAACSRVQGVSLCTHSAVTPTARASDRVS